METDIIRMAREANRYASNQTGDSYEWHFIRDERFAALVAAVERESCALLAEQTICDTHLPTGINIYGSRVAAAIRARGDK